MDVLAAIAAIDAAIEAGIKIVSIGSQLKSTLATNKTLTDADWQTLDAQTKAANDAYAQAVSNLKS